MVSKFTSITSILKRRFWRLCLQVEILKAKLLAVSSLRKLFWPTAIPVEWGDPQRRPSDENHLQQSPTCRPNGIGVSLDKATSLKAWLGDANSTPKDRNVGPALLEVVWRILKEQEQPEVTQCNLEWGNNRLGRKWLGPKYIENVERTLIKKMRNNYCGPHQVISIGEDCPTAFTTNAHRSQNKSRNK